MGSHRPPASPRWVAVAARTWLRRVLPLAAAAAGLLAAPRARAQSVDPVPALGQPHTVTFDHYSLMIDGRRTYVYAGEFHGWRLPSPDLWRDVFEKMKAAGFNTVTTYFDWGYHSPKAGVYDFTGVRDLDAFLDQAAAAGLYVIARPGPYINAETDGGGFPGWLTTIKGVARTTAPDYLAASNEWLSQVDPIIARHQLTNGTGTVILCQVENEYYRNNADGRQYMTDLEQKLRADGITVPLSGNHNAAFASGPGAVELSGFDSYPQGFNASTPENWSRAPMNLETNDHDAIPVNEPLYFAEFQGGSFDFWGGPGYAACRELTNANFENVFYKTLLGQGTTLLSLYMTYGGTSWGWLPEPGVYSSYDYGAVLDEARQLSSKYGEQKLIATFTQSVAPLRETEAAASLPPSNANLTVLTRVNPSTGTAFYLLEHGDTTSTTVEQTSLPVTAGDQFYPSVPQEPGTSVTVNGRDAKLLVANYPFARQHLAYSTSEIMTQQTSGREDLLVLYGARGNQGETVLRYPSQPRVDTLPAGVTQVWDEGTKTLRLNYVHEGVKQVRVTSRGVLLDLVLADKDAAKTFWVTPTNAGPLLVRGPYLVRSAAVEGDTATLQADVDSGQVPTVLFPRTVRHVALNVPLGAPAYELPALNDWKFAYATPERNAGFDDSGWTDADHVTTNNPNAPGSLPVLYEDDYGFHHGNVWFRGHFTATGQETGIQLDGEGGSAAGLYGVWFNGALLGTQANGSGTFNFPAGTLRVGQDNVVAVLVENIGHDEDFSPNDSYKSPRGVRTAVLQGSGATGSLRWKIQGARGGEDLPDPVRGPMNASGTYGERSGWFLPGFPDAGWTPVNLPDSWTARGVAPGTAWYRTTFALHLPAGTDVPVGLQITDDPSRHYRAQIFLNGWMMGIYVNDLGPQHVFSLPTGLLRPDGENTLAIAVWGEDAASARLGHVRLVAYGAYQGGVPVRPVASPGWDAATWGAPQVPADLSVSVTTASAIAQAGQQFTVRARFANTAAEGTITGGQAAISLPAGWTLVRPAAAVPLGAIPPGSFRQVNWSVQPPADVAPGVYQVGVNASFAAAGGSPGSTAGALTVSVPFANLAATFNNAATTSDANTNPGPGFLGFDGIGSTFSQDKLTAAGFAPGAAVTVQGVPFQWPASAPATPDNTLSAGQAIAVSGQGKQLAFLLATNNAPLSGTGTVYYTDGSSAAFTLSVGNFYYAPGTNGNPANTVAVSVPTINYPSGPATHTLYIFYQAVPVDPAKTVQAVVLPKLAPSVVNSAAALHVFALAVQ